MPRGYSRKQAQTGTLPCRVGKLSSAAPCAK